MPLYTTLFPAFARASADPEALRRAYTRAQTLLTSIALPLGVGVALEATNIVQLLLGQKWLLAVLVIQVLGPTAAFQTMGSLAHPLGMAVGNTKLLFKRDLLYFVTRVPIVSAAMFFAGLPGALFGRAVAVVLEVVLNMNVVRTITGSTYLAQTIGSYRSFVGIGVMTLTVLCLPPISSPILDLALGVSFGAASYVLTHVGVWLVAGAPDGPEREIIGIVRGMSARRTRTS